MTSKVIVFVTDGGDQRFGEVSVFDSSGEAERLARDASAGRLRLATDPRVLRRRDGSARQSAARRRPRHRRPGGGQRKRSARPPTADQKEAISGEEGEPEAEPAYGGNGSLPRRIPARMVEMMPEMFH